MNRRALLALLTASLAAPRALAQKPPEAKKRLGLFLRGQDKDEVHRTFASNALGNALTAQGWVEGETLELQVVVVDEDEARYPAAARQLVETKPDAIYTNTWFLARALQTATRTIPIVYFGGDPVAMGLVKSAAAPAGNLTGFSLAFGEVVHKQIELLKQVQPKLATIATFHSKDSPLPIESYRVDAIRAAGLEVKLFDSLSELGATMAKSRPDGRLALQVPIWMAGYQKQGDANKDIVRSALRYRLPTIAIGTDFVRDGGLMSFTMFYQGDWQARLATMIGKMLRGGDPATTPIELPTHSRLGVNRATAAAIGVEIPQELLLRADYIVEK